LHVGVLPYPLAALIMIATTNNINIMTMIFKSNLVVTTLVFFLEIILHKDEEYDEYEMQA
jgi:hypothetical protein